MKFSEIRKPLRQDSVANFVPALEGKESGNNKRHKAYLQNNRDIVTFHYHPGFSCTSEHLGTSKNFRRCYSGLVELFLILDCCNSATAKFGSSRISKAKPQNNITNGCVLQG